MSVSQGALRSVRRAGPRYLAEQTVSQGRGTNAPDREPCAPRRQASPIISKCSTERNLFSEQALVQPTARRRCGGFVRCAGRRGDRESALGRGTTPLLCHSRESGNPGDVEHEALPLLDSRFRGNDIVGGAYPEDLDPLNPPLDSHDLCAEKEQNGNKWSCHGNGSSGFIIRQDAEIGRFLR